MGIIAVVLIAVLIAANVVINYFSIILHSALGGDSINTSTSAEDSDALTHSDKVVQLAAEESIVLLKNDDDFLPLDDLTKVNLFGYGSTDAGFLLTGGGSGGKNITDEQVTKKDLSEAFTAADIEYNRNLMRAYETFSTFDADYRQGGSTGANVTQSLLNPDPSFYTAQLMNECYAYSHTAVVTLSRWGAENGGSQELVNIGTYANGAFLELTNNEKAMFNALQNMGFDVIVLLNTCNNLELGFLEEYSCIKACLYVGIPGQSGTMAIPRIIKGEVNPSGRMSDTLPYDHQTYNPVYMNPYYVNNDMAYQEGIYFGYKWYETADAEGYFDSVTNSHGTGYDAVVQYSFGYGLSYTQFSWEFTSVPSVLSDENNVVKVKVTNVGDTAGKDVVQLYVHAPYTNGGIEKAERVLVDFAKTPTLYPSSQADADHPNQCEVELKFSAYDLASYDAYDKNSNDFKGYELERGDYTLYAMKNSHDVASALTFTLNVSTNETYSTDPVTGTQVKNLFTGSDAYASCPIDGNVSDRYLSRSNHFANFPTARLSVNVSNKSAAANYVYDGYNGKNVSSYEYGSDYGLFIVGEKVTEGETETLKKATKDMLDGKEEASLAFNEDVMQELKDYDSEVWDIVLDQMTKEEIISIISFGGFTTQTVYSVGKPRCDDKDGPAGFNNNVANSAKATNWTLLPDEALLGCSFNKGLAYEIGAAQGVEAKEYGINGWYAPGVNLHRSVYNSRNYEYYSEDAVLSGKLASQVVSGAKDNNLYCYVKHFAVSEAGQNPNEKNTWLTEQALRETYLKAFEIVVKEGKANAIMSAFNNVGAVLSGYNHAMLTTVLREEWGFRGSVITDWFTGSGYMSKHINGIIAGNDLWLCGSTGSASAPIDFNNPAQAYAARRSAKNILYTFVVTNLSSDEIAVNAAPHSALLDGLWIGLNVLLGAGIIVCVIFVILPIDKAKKPAEGGEEKVES